MSPSGPQAGAGCCRSALAASRAQAHLQGAAEEAAEDLQSRIAAAEAAVAEAEQAAKEAASLQNDAAHAAQVASGHSDSASAQSDTAVQVFLSCQATCHLVYTVKLPVVGFSISVTALFLLSLYITYVMHRTL